MTATKHQRISTTDDDNKHHFEKLNNHDQLTTPTIKRQKGKKEVKMTTTHDRDR